MKYRVGLPLWRLAYRLGMTLYYRAVIRKDRSDNVFYVASSDILAVSTEGRTIEELEANMSDCAMLLIQDEDPALNDPKRVVCKLDLKLS